MSMRQPSLKEFGAKEGPCPTCHGTGKILINVRFKDCEDCKGKGTLKFVEPI